VAEWQTRRTQNPVPSRECGFKSLLRHSLLRLDDENGRGGHIKHEIRNPRFHFFDRSVGRCTFGIAGCLLHFLRRCRQRLVEVLVLGFNDGCARCVRCGRRSAIGILVGNCGAGFIAANCCSYCMVGANGDDAERVGSGIHVRRTYSPRGRAGKASSPPFGMGCENA
jgi:hypothetical protein